MAKKTVRVNVSTLLGTPASSPGVFSTGIEELTDERLSVNQQVHMIEIDRILDSPYQTREEIDDAIFAQLVSSIQTEGFQNAITVRPYLGKEGFYQIVGGGHNRRDAAKAAGLTTIPVFIMEVSDRSTAIRTAQENLARIDLNPVEAGKLFLKIRQDFSLTQDELAEALGMKDRYRIKQCEAAAQSAPDIQVMLREKSTGGLRAMSYLRRLDAYPDERAAIIEQFLLGELTTDGVRVAVEEVLKETSEPTLPSLHEEQSTLVLSSTATTSLPIAKHGEVPSTPVSPPGQASEEDQADHTSVTPASAALSDSPHQKPRRTPATPSRVLERSGQVSDVLKRFQRYQRMLGDAVPSEEERAALHSLISLVQDLLQRT